MARRPRDKVVPLDQPVQVSRAQTEIEGVGVREVQIHKRPGVRFSLEIAEFGVPDEAAETAKVIPIRKPSE